MPLDLTPEERAAVTALLTSEPAELDDLTSAIRRSMGVRKQNSTNGALAIQAARRNGMSWRALQDATDIPQSVLRSWAAPAKGRRP